MQFNVLDIHEAMHQTPAVNLRESFRDITDQTDCVLPTQSRLLAETLPETVALAPLKHNTQLIFVVVSDALQNGSDVTMFKLCKFINFLEIGSYLSGFGRGVNY